MSERVKLENKETSSYLIDKLSQINSVWVDGGSGAAPQETGNKKTAAWDGAAAPHGKTPPAQLSSALTARVPPYLNRGGLTEAGLAGVWN